jgi:acetyltransferase
MTIRNLDQLLAPGSVALIGASDHAGSVGFTMVSNMLGGRYRGRVMLVNPHHELVQGEICYPDVASLPEVPALAVIATPAPTVPGLVAELGMRGCKAAAVISAGFDPGLRQALREAARPYLLRLLGPNCVGLLVPGIGLNAGFAHLTPAAGRIAFLAQSGAIVTTVIDWAAARGIGFSHLLSMGEMADVDFADVLDYLAGDPETAAVLLYVETIGNARKFISAARLAARGKPIIAIKAGRHAEGAKAVASHTGALAGADAVYDAAFRRAGVLRVYDLAELFAATETLASAEPLAGDRLAILTNGGGIGILATDALIDQGGRLAEIGPETMRRLDAALPPIWSHGNPVDIIGDADAARYEAAIEPLLADPEIDAVLALNCPTAVADGMATAQAVLGAHGRVRRCLLTSWVGEATASRARNLIASCGVPTYETPEDAVRGFMHLVRWHKSRAQLMQTPPSIPDSFRPDRAAAQAVIESVRAAGRRLLTGPEARAVFAAYDMPLPALRVAHDPAEAAKAAAELGRAVALKILSPDISHKSDVGGVALGLESAAEVEAAARRMLARVAEARPGARIEGFTVEAMIQSTGGIELILGMSEDSQFGPVMLFGQGGVAVEQIADRTLALPPLNMALAREMIEQTRIFRLLRGYRDRPSVDLDAVALTLVKLSQLTTDLDEVAEVDINPLLASPAGVVALDARIALGDRPRTGARLAIRPYPAELARDVRLADGTIFHLRPIRPEDEAALRRAFDRLSPATIRLRFFLPMKHLSHQMAAQLTQIDYDREMAFVLTDPGPAQAAEIHGVVRLSADPDGERAEFAVVVEDSMTARGIGRMLMRQIIDYAAGRGIRELFGDVLADNAPMLDLCRHLGFRPLGPAREGVLRVSIDLSDGRGRSLAGGDAGRRA